MKNSGVPVKSKQVEFLQNQQLAKAIKKKCLKSNVINGNLVISYGCDKTSTPIAGTTDCVTVNNCVNTQLGLAGTGSLTNFAQAVVSAYEAHFSAGGADPEFASEVIATLNTSPGATTAVLAIVNAALATQPNAALSNLCAYINSCIDSGLLVVSTEVGNLITAGSDGGAFLNAPVIKANETITSVTSLVPGGHLIAQYTSENGVINPVHETVTVLGNGVLTGTVLATPFTNEAGVTTSSTVDLAALMNSAVFQSDDNQVLSANVNSTVGITFVPVPVADPDADLTRVDYELEAHMKPTFIKSGVAVSTTNKVITEDTFNNAPHVFAATNGTTTRLHGEVLGFVVNLDQTQMFTSIVGADVLIPYSPWSIGGVGEVALKNAHTLPVNNGRTVKHLMIDTDNVLYTRQEQENISTTLFLPQTANYPLTTITSSNFSNDFYIMNPSNFTLTAPAGVHAFEVRFHLMTQFVIKNLNRDVKGYAYIVGTYPMETQVPLHTGDTDNAGYTTFILNSWGTDYLLAGQTKNYSIENAIRAKAGTAPIVNAGGYGYNQFTKVIVSFFPKYF